MMSENTPPDVQRHAPVTTLADLLTLDNDECFAGYNSAERGDPEPGMNHSRSYYFGWRARMYRIAQSDLKSFETDYADMPPLVCKGS